jgi:hypothetical protein
MRKKEKKNEEKRRLPLRFFFAFFSTPISLFFYQLSFSTVTWIILCSPSVYWAPSLSRRLLVAAFAPCSRLPFHFFLSHVALSHSSQTRGLTFTARPQHTSLLRPLTRPARLTAAESHPALRPHIASPRNSRPRLHAPQPGSLPTCLPSSLPASPYVLPFHQLVGTLRL